MLSDQQLHLNSVRIRFYVIVFSVSSVFGLAANQQGRLEGGHLPLWCRHKHTTQVTGGSLEASSRGPSFCV